MAIFIAGKAELIRSNRLVIETYESNGAAQWDDSLEVERMSDGDIKISTTRNHSLLGDNKTDLKEVWAAVIEISPEQARILADYLNSVLK
jgi:hypothetical protein